MTNEPKRNLIYTVDSSRANGDETSLAIFHNNAILALLRGGEAEVVLELIQQLERMAMNRPTDGLQDEFLKRVALKFDSDDTCAEFMPEDGDGGFVNAIHRMAREIDRLRATDGLREALRYTADCLETVYQEAGLNPDTCSILKGARKALAATPQAEAAPPMLPSDEEAAKALGTQIAEALWSDGLIDDADAIGGYVQDVLTPAFAAHRTAHQNAGDGWDMKAVKLVGAISALKGYTTTTGPGTPDYFQRLRDHYIAELEKAAAAFLPPLPTPPRNGRAKR